MIMVVRMFTLVDVVIRLPCSLVRHADPTTILQVKVGCKTAPHKRRALMQMRTRLTALLGFGGMVVTALERAGLRAT